jgi:hypothetical protein
MADTQNPAPETTPEARGFPFFTAVVALAALFLFAGLVLVAYRYPNVLGGAKAEPTADPVEKLDEVRARNQAVLDGTDPSAKMSGEKATAEVLAHTAKTKDKAAPHGRLPYPAEPQAKAVPAPAEKKKP